MSIEGTPDYEALDRKRVQLLQDLPDVGSAEMKSRILDSFCALTPPINPPALMTLVTIQSAGKGGGVSRKLGNLRLNWKKLFSELSDVILTTVGANDHPYLIPLAALSLWNKLWAHSHIKLTKELASTLFVMWQKCDTSHEISKKKAYAEANDLFRTFGWPSITLIDFDDYIKSLIDMQCVEMKGNQLWLREWVKVTY
jgi:hypothetical protein